MEKNPWEDCNKVRRPFYKPIDVAIRWCGLADKELMIQQAVS